jgi:hypothetical protein
MSDESPDIFADSGSTEAVAPSTTTSEAPIKSAADEVAVVDDADETTEEVVEDKVEEDKEPTSEELLEKEIEDILAGKDVEKEDTLEDEDTLLNRVSLKDITKDYPDILKKYPDLKDMIFREKAYTEIFPTVEDARESQERVVQLTSTVKKAIDGDTTGVLRDLYKFNPPSVVKFADNILPTLYNEAPELYKRAVLPTVRQILVDVYKSGNAAENKSLMLAVQHISQALFNDPNLPEINFNDAEPTRREDPEKEQLRKQLSQVQENRIKGFVNELQAHSRNMLKDRVVKALGPREKNGLTSYVYEKVVTDCIDAYDKLIARDPQFKGILDKKWHEVIDAGIFDNNQKTKILSAYLGRAHDSIPAIARKRLAEAKGDNKVTPIKTKQVASTDKKTPNQVKVSEMSADKIDWEKTSKEDFLFGDKVVLRKG